ncbi:enoyl-CoA hydratase/isomerase family protein [Neobacillus sp. PS3-40]|uniref:enoyl-CoA hydratase/isomerase family protein n=1 Tax=Neobacillus sp. PS3-40 TaxID=3070679 RepID=UPI0027E11144|nr:enoyl-CoA hydratase/isomerase family protein [Neobacillus sp. PS3-40]WML43598.1 enoyl-CoA hydratase/isomerase family protein [Neobacillus sp. PS3-40]
MAYTIERREKGYLLFTITRNEKRNAINYEVMQGLEEAIRIANDSDINALVITGSGDQAFCSGGDLTVFHSLETSTEAYAMLSKMSNVLYSLLTLPKPTVALVNGIAIGGGCELAIACDFRLAKKGIKAGFVQGKQAITTGWGGGTILAEKLTVSNAMKLLMEAEIQPVEHLLINGFIDDLFEETPIKACEEFLGNLLSRDQNVLKSYKNIWIRKWTQTKLRERIEEEVRTCAGLWEGEAHHSYVKKFMNKKHT